jgi:hypothetical protein
VTSAQIKGVWITALHKLLYVSDTISAYRYQGVGAVTKAVGGRLWDVYPNGDFPLATELTDYIKITEPRPAWGDYQFLTFGTNGNHGIVTWPMYDPDDGANGKVIMAGIVPTWSPLSVKPTVTINTPVIDPTTLAISEWTYTDAFAWTGILQSFCYCKDGGVWYRHKRGLGASTPPLQAYSGGAWGNVAANWASLSVADQAFGQNTRWIWSDEAGTIYGLSAIGLWSYSSGGDYAIITKLTTSYDTTVVSRLNCIVDGYIYFIGTYQPSPVGSSWGQYLCRMPATGGAVTKLLWLHFGNAFAEATAGALA